MTALEIILAYHDRTKHHPQRFARGPGHLDWANQPEPFRRFDGATLCRLPLPNHDDTPPYDQIYLPGAVPPRPLNLESISLLLYLSLAISAWKQAGRSRWALRCNPSSGNLHPTEGYLILPALAGLPSSPGVYHYAAREHALEQRAALTPETWSALTAGLPRGAFLAGLSTIFWREAWKYGERAFRYCQHDAGHALAALRLAAAALGWKLVTLTHLSDDDVARLLGLDRPADFARAENESPELLAAIFPARGESPAQLDLPTEALAAVRSANWTGRASRLSREQTEWELIDLVAEATHKPRTPLPSEPFATGSVGVPPASKPPASGNSGVPRQLRAGNPYHNSEPLAPSEGPGPGAWRTGFYHAPSESSPIDHPARRAPIASAARIFRQRRSALDFDGRTGIPLATFVRMLQRLMPTGPTGGAPHRLAFVPWDALPGPTCIDLIFFVHLVEGLHPGLYALIRRPGTLDELRGATSPDFAWIRAPTTPVNLPLYLLKVADVRTAAAQLCLGQAIAGQGAFSLGMLADFERPLRESGPWFYRRLFWEAGLLGQVLYLEAEAAGIRATGIGAYFDDWVHSLLGLRDRRFQILYHFAVGGPVDDPRITTLPAYQGTD